MKITNKFEISEKAFKGMIDAGIIPCQWATYEEIYRDFEAMRATGKTRTAIYLDLSIKYNMSDRNIKGIISRMGKI